MTSVLFQKTFGPVDGKHYYEKWTGYFNRNLWNMIAYFREREKTDKNSVTGQPHRWNCIPKTGGNMEYGNDYTEETLRSLERRLRYPIRDNLQRNGKGQRNHPQNGKRPERSPTRTAGRRPARILSAKRGLLPAGTYRNDKERAGDGSPCVPCAVLPHEKQKGVLQHRRRSVGTRCCPRALHRPDLPQNVSRHGDATEGAGTGRCISNTVSYAPLTFHEPNPAGTGVTIP